MVWRCQLFINRWQMVLLNTDILFYVIPTSRVNQLIWIKEQRNLSIHDQELIIIIIIIYLFIFLSIRLSVPPLLYSSCYNKHSRKKNLDCTIEVWTHYCLIYSSSFTLCPQHTTTQGQVASSLVFLWIVFKP